ncbi:hypothetical protein B0J17DRAFT_577761 [Rhizoctonia solani]|nr:hypothetical protein B0J17DRAFT_577761 [Rhizoctonia solani]
MAPPPPPPPQQLSACVTRILSLSGFPQSLKTRDVQQAFSEYDQERGGFRIKWVDDTSLLLVFTDATVAKKAYLNTLLSPPAALLSPTSTTRVQIKPYDGPEAQTIIQAVQQRAHVVAYKGHASRASFSGGAMGSFGAGTSVPRPNNAAGPTLNTGSLGRSSGASMWNTAAAKASTAGNASPTLPNLPSHPTLNSLISSASPQLSSGELAEEGSGGEGDRNGPRIGEPGKRMVAAGLGVRRPSASGGVGINKGSGGADKALSEVQKALGGVSITE